MSGARSAALLLAAVLVAPLAGCGDDPDNPLEATEEQIAELRGASIDLEVSASTAGEDPAGPVGFRVTGSYSFDSPGDLAVLDVTYTQLLGGDDEQATRVISDGREAFVEVGGEVVPVPEGQLGPLRLGESGGVDVGELGLAGWVDDPQTSAEGEIDVVTGDLDVAELLSDLGRVVGPISGTSLPLLDEAVAEDVAGSVESSDVEVRIRRADRTLERFESTMAFGADVPEAVRAGLGDAAGVTLRVVASVEPLEAELTVEVPTAG